MRYKLVFPLLIISVILFACDKKYVCRCTGYEGLMSVERYKYRSESSEQAKTTCDSHEQGTLSDGTQCELE